MPSETQPERCPEDQLPISCLGEALVDLICERNLAEGEMPGIYVAWPGGALANVAVAIRRAGLPAALIGGVGADRWGDWLAGTLDAEGVGTSWLASVAGAATPVALIDFGPDQEPSFQVYGDQIGPTMAAASGFLADAIGGSQALVVGSNTMVGKIERDITREAIRLTRARGLPLLIDPNYRPGRWTDARIARDFCLELARAATVMKLNQAEARLLTGREDPLTAARELAATGPELVVVTAGRGEIVTAGAVEARYRPEPLDPVSPLGAGDAFMGGLAAGLASRGWDPARAGEVLEEASRAAARVCLGWGAQ